MPEVWRAARILDGAMAFQGAVTGAAYGVRDLCTAVHTIAYISTNDQIVGMQALHAAYQLLGAVTSSAGCTGRLDGCHCGKKYMSFAPGDLAWVGSCGRGQFIRWWHPHGMQA